MFIGIYYLPDGRISAALYHKWEDWHKDTFSPEIRIIATLELSLKTAGEIFWTCRPGKRIPEYQKKRMVLEDVAHQWDDLRGNYAFELGDLIQIQNWFYTNGKRYGLLKDFQENGIC